MQRLETDKLKHTSVIEGYTFGPPASVEGRKLVQVRARELSVPTGLERIIFSWRVNWPLVHARGRRYSIANGTVTRTWQPLHVAAPFPAAWRMTRFIVIIECTDSLRYSDAITSSWCNSPENVTLSGLIKVLCDVFIRSSFRNEEILIASCRKIPKTATRLHKVVRKSWQGSPKKQV